MHDFFQLFSLVIVSKIIKYKMLLENKNSVLYKVTEPFFPVKYTGHDDYLIKIKYLWISISIILDFFFIHDSLSNFNICK